MELNLLEEYNGMSPEQKQLVDDLFLAIRLSDNDKIKQATAKHFETFTIYLNHNPCSHKAKGYYEKA